MKSIALLIALIALTFNSSALATQGCQTLNDKAIKLAQPDYPIEARKAGIEGKIAVHVEVDEKGNVVFTQASPKRNVSLLLEPAEKAARKTKFPAGRLSGDLHFVFVIQDADARGTVR